MVVVLDMLSPRSVWHHEVRKYNLVPWPVHSIRSQNALDFHSIPYHLIFTLNPPLDPKFIVRHHGYGGKSNAEVPDRYKAIRFPLLWHGLRGYG